MFSNTFIGIKLEFDGLYYGGNYEIEIFSDGRLYYSYIENDSIEIKKGSFQVTQKEVMIFEEMMEYFEFLKTQRNYMVSEYGFGNGVLVIQKKNGQIFLLDTYLVGIKYIRNFNIKMKYANVLDLFREFNGASLNLVAVYNENKERVGYLPKEQSEIIARLIDSGKKMIAIPIPFDGEVALKIYLVD